MFERVFIWTCNLCGTSVQRTNYGLPPGWIYIKKMGDVPHACGECALTLPTTMQTSPKKWDAECMTFQI